MVNHHLRAAISDEWETKRLLHLRPSLSTLELNELIHPPGGRHYGHVMPTRVQAKMVVWDKLKFYAEKVGGKPNESELLYRLPNGNKVQLFGSDDPDAMRGPAFSGLSFDEYSQQPRNIFSEVLSKALGDHLGYAIFLGTIKGKDHLYDTYKAASETDEWFSLWQDIDKSLATEEGITIQLLQQAMNDDRKLVIQGLMSEAEFQQEWYLSTDAAIKGSFYLDQLTAARKENRVTRVPHEPTVLVDTDWDLGIDAMAVWFSQQLSNGEVRMIDYYEDIGGGLEAAIKAVKGQMPNPGNDPRIDQANSRRARYMYGEHWGPHDIEVREISSGKTRRQIAAGLGLNFKVTPKLGVDEGISATQMFFPRCYFDQRHCEDGLSALANYRRSYNQRLDMFTATPVHDSASHGADAFRGRAVRYRLPARPEQARATASEPYHDSRTAHEAWMG